MKQSNLALRSEHEDVDAPAPDTPPTTQLSPAAQAAQRLARTRALGLEYRAIVIGDEGLRPFRVR
jgi:hypothetical protein